MSSERPTVRPVTLARLVEVAYVCEDEAESTSSIETRLDVTHRRARETILEALRIGLLEEISDGGDDEFWYVTADAGESFLEVIRNERWQEVSSFLKTNSPHYATFLDVLVDSEPVAPTELLEEIETREVDSPYEYNQTSIEVVGDWAERLGAIQRNAFTGVYYTVRCRSVPENFPEVLLSTFDELEETAGVNLRQRYLSIPELREHTCQRLQCPRAVFDDALVSLAQENVGKLELSGAPLDTGAKDAKLGIKEIALDEEGGLISTTHSTERVMAGVEQFDKQYYYLAVHDRDLTFTKETSQ